MLKIALQTTAVLTILTMLGGVMPAKFAVAATVEIDEPTESPACTVDVVSGPDTQNGVHTFTHAAWVTVPGAQWIWRTEFVTDSTVTETQTFTQDFVWNGESITGIDFQMAADNQYEVKLNDTVIGSSNVEDNFSSAASLSVDSSLLQIGSNTLTFTITNIGVPSESNDPQGNPAGFAFHMTIDGTGTSCDEVPEVPAVDVCINITGDQALVPEGMVVDEANNCTTTPAETPDTYELFGFVWNDSDTDDVIDAGESNLSGWTVQVVNASNSAEVYTSVTDGAGRYSLNVPTGTWIISEQTQSGWVLLSPGDSVNEVGTYTVTVPVETPSEESVPSEVTFINWLIPTAFAATLAQVGPFNFGNKEDTPTHHHHHHHTTNPDGEVLGDSTSTIPVGEVLGDATTTMPVGAPNTGAGGTSPVSVNFSIVNAILDIRAGTKKSK